MIWLKDISNLKHKRFMQKKQIRDKKITLLPILKYMFFINKVRKQTVMQKSAVTAKYITSKFIFTEYLKKIKTVNTVKYNNCKRDNATAAPLSSPSVIPHQMKNTPKSEKVHSVKKNVFPLPIARTTRPMGQESKRPIIM